ncbi:hypothetical protein HY745_07870 [Candidatus Desantisbacteria bacterium]|nr:hypothetical protein [Candidatus Desantisbacteria bacterium]
MEETGKDSNISTKTDSSEKLEKKNVILFGIGFIILILGYFVLTYTDSRGQNWASILSPIMLVGAYIIMGISMIIK